MSFFTVFGALFVTLKLTHLIDWSWWWVLSPFYPVVLVLLFALLCGFAVNVLKQ